MAAITADGTQGSLNGVTAVTVAAAPGAGVTRVVRFLSVHNKDTTDVVVTLYKTVSGTDYIIDKQPGLAADQTWRPIRDKDVFVIKGTTESLRVVMSGAPATTQPQYTTCWVDKS